MSSWHARIGDSDGNSFRVLFHLPIPSANNRVGVNYRSALVGSGIGGKTEMTEGSGAGLISSAEKADILSGAVYEYGEIITTNPGETAGQLQARIDARFTELSNANAGVLLRIQRQLTYWGHDRVVV